MKIFIEIPRWLGDAIMCTPAIENIIKSYPNAKITLFGSFISTTALKNHPNVKRVIIDESKNATLRAIWLYKMAKELGGFDISFSFRQRFYPKLLSFFLDSKKKFIYKRTSNKPKHQVLRYNDFVNNSLNTTFKAGSLKLYFTPKKFPKKTLGLNPGATYGSAKRWYPDRFAKVAKELSHKYDIIIFGSQNEKKMADEIEDFLKKHNIKNYQNLAGKTTIEDLISLIGGLDLFITNDSGPMHIAAAFKIPTIALFGPTKWYETSPWQNKNARIIKKDLPCMPCMKRSCPIKTHQCMKDITAKDVLKEVEKLCKY